MPKYDLTDVVEASVLVATEKVTITGTIIARTVQGDSLYDLLATDGKRHTKIAENSLTLISKGDKSKIITLASPKARDGKKDAPPPEPPKAKSWIARLLSPRAPAEPNKAEAA